MGDKIWRIYSQTALLSSCLLCPPPLSFLSLLLVYFQHSSGEHRYHRTFSMVLCICTCQNDSLSQQVQSPNNKKGEKSKSVQYLLNISKGNKSKSQLHTQMKSNKRQSALPLHITWILTGCKNYRLAFTSTKRLMLKRLHAKCW